MDEGQNNEQPQPPPETASEFRGLVENLAQPVVITDGDGKIRFMNSRAERLLAQGLRERVEAHLKSPAHRKPVSQVRFRLNGRGEIILRILRSDIEWNWQGRPATLMSLTDVTADSATARRLTQEIAKSRERAGDRQERRGTLETQAESPAADSHPIAQETSPFLKSWEEALAERVQNEAPLREPATEKEGVEQSQRAEQPQPGEAEPEAELVIEQIAQGGRTVDELTAARDELEARTEQGIEEQWSALRRLQAAAAESERHVAEAQKQSAAEVQKARAERRQAQYGVRQLRKQIAEAIQQRDDAMRLAQEAKKAAEEFEARVRAHAGELVKVNEALRQETAECGRTREENSQLRRQAAESKTALEELAAQCDQYKARAEQCAEELRQQAAQQQQAQEEKQQLQQKLAKSMAAVETFRAGFETLTSQAKASADEAAKENEALRRKLAEHEREEESLRTMLKNRSPSGETFLGVIEKFKAEGQAPPRQEIPGA